MCASAAPAVDKGLQSALRRPGEEGTPGSAAGANARGGAGSPSPKRVTFVLPAPPAGTPAISAAAAHLQGAQPAARSGGGSSAPGSSLRPPPPVALRPASDELLCFLAEVDTPHRPLSPLGLAPLAASRRWPSNEALVASDAEIACTVDMSDLPLSPRTPPASPAGLAQAFFDLMPQQRLARATSAGQQGTAGDRAGEASEAAEAAASAAGEPSAFAATAAEAEAGPSTPLAALTGLLCRFLSAAATSGSSIAELAATNTGSGVSSGFSRSASVDTLYSARSSSNELSTYGSACSNDEL